MKDRILRLRKKGKSYAEIVSAVGCAKSTVAYYCGAGQKEKTLARTESLRAANAVMRKMDNFKHSAEQRRKRKQLRDKLYDFRKRRNPTNCVLSYKDIVSKYGSTTSCYLTGRAVNLADPSTYTFDHKVAVASGGEATLDNLGIACSAANLAKHTMSVPEFIQLCKEVLEHNGYDVTLKS